MDIKKILKQYDSSNITVATLGSHSALDICSGAKKENFKTLVIAQRGREKPYNTYYKTQNNQGCVDKVLLLENFREILQKNNQKFLQENNVIFIPHRSFEVYLNFDYQAIEKEFFVPFFGNRNILRIEERAFKPNQYDLLKEANIRIPKIFNSAEEIDRPVLVKVLEKERGFERAFFITNSPADFKQKSQQYLKKGIINKEALQNAVIEEFILGVQVNLNYFYSPVSERLEFLGSDTRRQTNLEGFIKLPSTLQKEIEQHTRITYEEAGHMAVTILESMLKDVFEIGERFVAAAKKHYAPGIIGPFALQGFILPGPPKKEFVIFDVSPRVPGSPGIKFTPYSQYLFRKSLSMGERIALEIKQAIDNNLLDKIVT